MIDIRQFLFKNRGYTPIPIALAILYYSDFINLFIYIGILLIIMGEGVRLNSVRYAGGLTRTRKVGANKLCASGPFAYVRNPLYLGNVIIYTGIVLFAGGNYMWEMLIITFGFFSLQYLLIIFLEEKTLLGLFGQEYERYIESVPRFIPRIVPWKGGGKTDPMSWHLTLKTEKRTLQLIIIFIVLLIIKTYILNPN